MKVVPGFKEKYLLSIFVVKSAGLMWGKYAASVVSCVVLAVPLALPPAIPEEEPPHAAVSMTSAKIALSSVIRFMFVSTFHWGIRDSPRASHAVAGRALRLHK